MADQVPPQESRSWSKARVTIVAIVLAGAAIAITTVAIKTPRGVDVNQITGYDMQSGLLPPAQHDLGIVLAVNYHEYRSNSTWWSFAYYGCVFLSAFLSASAAFVLKLESFPDKPALKKDLAALFSTLAAVLITLTTVGNFQQKWQANRLAATAMQNLIYEVWKGDAPESAADIYSRIEQVNLLRNQEIVGGDPSSRRRREPESSPKDRPGNPPENKSPDHPVQGK